MKRAGRTYPRGRRWKEIKAQRKPVCEATGEPVMFLCQENGRLVNVGHAHHLVAERFLRSFCPGMDPHHQINIITLSNSAHSAATAAESRLFRKKGPDVLGFLSLSNAAGILEDRLRAALRHYGLMR